MLTAKANKRLSLVGPGTPMGSLLRRYWHPVATTTALAREAVLPVRLLGEDLALYQTERGKLGLVARRCPHRGSSLAYTARCTHALGAQATDRGRAFRSLLEREGPTLLTDL